MMKESSDRGHAIAQFNLGVCYIQGVGVPKNFTEAFKYFKLSADRGFSVALLNLANCYGSGVGIGKNLYVAARYFKTAAVKGRADASTALEISLSRISFDDIPKLEENSWEKTSDLVKKYFRYMYGIGVKIDEFEAKKCIFDAMTLERHPFATAVVFISDFLTEQSRVSFGFEILQKCIPNHNTTLCFLAKDDCDESTFEMVKRSAEMGNPHAKYLCGHYLEIRGL